jgi:hypothetical protein
MSPKRRAKGRFEGGTLSDKMDINTRLSNPKTTSRTHSVTKLIQTAGSNNISILDHP